MKGAQKSEFDMFSDENDDNVMGLLSDQSGNSLDVSILDVANLDYFGCRSALIVDVVNRLFKSCEDRKNNVENISRYNKIVECANELVNSNIESKKLFDESVQNELNYLKKVNSQHANTSSSGAMSEVKDVSYSYARPVEKIIPPQPTYIQPTFNMNTAYRNPPYLIPHAPIWSRHTSGGFVPPPPQGLPPGVQSGVFNSLQSYSGNSSGSIITPAIMPFSVAPNKKNGPGMKRKLEHSFESKHEGNQGNLNDSHKNNWKNSRFEGSTSYSSSKETPSSVHNTNNTEYYNDSHHSSWQQKEYRSQSSSREGFASSTRTTEDRRSSYTRNSEYNYRNNSSSSSSSYSSSHSVVGDTRKEFYYPKDYRSSQKSESSHYKSSGDRKDRDYNSYDSHSKGHGSYDKDNSSYPPAKQYKSEFESLNGNKDKDYSMSNSKRSTHAHKSNKYDHR